MKPYDAYLFDMDGTLTQTFEPWLEIIQATLDTYELQADRKTIVRKVFGAAETGLVDLGIPAADLPAVFEEWDQKAATIMQEVALYPDVVEVLKTLKRQGKHLGLVTATVRTTVELILRKHNLYNVFDVIMTGDDMPTPKPDPAGINDALKQLGVTKDKAIMLGDSEKDIRAAHNAGIDSLLFFPPVHEDFHNREELQADKPTYTIASWRELLAELEEK